MAKKDKVEGPTTADEAKAEVERLMTAQAQPEEAPPQGETPAPAEPEVEPSVEGEEGRQAPEAPSPEPSPEVPPAEEAQAAETQKRRVLQIELTPEDEAELVKHGFKSGGSLLKSWREAAGALNREREARRAKDDEFQAMREQVAELRGSVQVLTQPKPEPPAPKLTDEQLAELAQSDPLSAARYIQSEADRKWQGRFNELEEKLELDRTKRTVQERTQFAFSSIPELRAVTAAAEKGEEPNPDHLEFMRRYTEALKQFPDLAQDGEKMLLAADAVRMRLFKEQYQPNGGKSAAPARAVSAKAPPRRQGDVFLEDTSGRAAASPKFNIAKATADEMERYLAEQGVQRRPED